MKNFIIDLRDMILTVIAAVFSLLGSVFALPGRILTWIGEGFVSFGGFIVKCVDKKHSLEK